MDPTIEKALERASNDEAAERMRREVCEAVAAALQATGALLLIGGSMIGRDRPQGESPFGFGSDAVVGLSTVAQIGGELLSGGAVLLKEGNRYAAAALLRQLVEVEYLGLGLRRGSERGKGLASLYQRGAATLLATAPYTGARWRSVQGF